jgi:hypothetical protein
VSKEIVLVAHDPAKTTYRIDGLIDGCETKNAPEGAFLLAIWRSGRPPSVELKPYHAVT